MKKLLLILFIVLTLLSLCACKDNADTPQEIADVPNIDHNILDADRHLGNSFENYSSEDTLLVEYGNRIYHAYNSRHEIMEYCTANDKETPLGIYGTNLSVYKNVLYYIGEDGTSIHAYDLATNTDSVWITGEEIAMLLPEPTYQYPRISDLIVTDYGMCMLYGDSQYLTHISFEKALISTSYESGMIFTHPGNNLTDLIVISSNKLCALYKNSFCIYDSSSVAYSYLPIDPYLFATSVGSDGHNSYFYSLLYPNLLKLDADSLSLTASIFFEEYDTHILPKSKYGDYIYFSVLKPDNSCYQFMRKSISDNSCFVLMDDCAVTHLTFTSNNMVYGITANVGEEFVSYFKTDIDFQNVTYLD